MERLARKSRGQVVSNHNTPRSIRSRLMNPRRKGPAGAAAELAPDSPTQQVARSASGKMALGPWLGSYGGLGESGSGLMGEAPPSPTLFATSAGRVFADLAGSPFSSMDLLPAAVELEAASQAEGRVGHDLERRGDGSASVAKRAELAAMMRRRMEGRSGGTARAPMRAAPRANAARRRYRMIGQARKAN